MGDSAGLGVVRFFSGLFYSLVMGTKGIREGAGDKISRVYGGMAFVIIMP